MTTSTSSPLHTLLLLSDSALPLGSFAFSSGLESFLAHHSFPSNAAKVAAFHQFLRESIRNTASTALPYVVAGYQRPETLDDLDNDFDASTPCTVSRRASITQGKALLTVWERALRATVSEHDVNDKSTPSINRRLSSDAIEERDGDDPMNGTAATTSHHTEDATAAHHISAFARDMKATTGKASTDDIFALKGHLAPLFGAVSRVFKLTIQDTAYVFLLNHAKAVLSAAVRASVFGPYQSQAVLASSSLQDQIKSCIDEFKDTPIEDAAVTSFPMDLWMGRHELLYSRIFNS